MKFSLFRDRFSRVLSRCPTVSGGFLPFTMSDLQRGYQFFEYRQFGIYHEFFLRGHIRKAFDMRDIFIPF
jgi:hypothetical protein